jgi:hypothetical protein
MERAATVRIQRMDFARQLSWLGPAGWAWLLYIGSPQSKEGDERKEAKLDAILRGLDPEDADELIARLDREFHRT